MKTTQQLTDEQEATRLDGLRALARIIARHALAHPGRYGNGEATERPAGGEAPAARKDGAA